MSKDTNQLLMIGAVALGAILVMKKASATGVPVYRPNVGTYPTTAPQPGTAAYSQWMAQQQANLANQQNNALFGLGRLLNGWFGGSGAGAAPGAGSFAIPGTNGGTTEIRNDDVPGQPGYGWRYFSDGTSIGPDGSYYKDGSLIYTPTDGSATNLADNTWNGDLSYVG